jgi:hypothetical protein
MTIKTINAKQISKISAEGITYTDDDGSEGFIDFGECYQNYLKVRLAPENLKRLQELNFIPDDKMPEKIERIKAWKEIGRRNILGNEKGYGLATDPKLDKPYFVLHQEPPIAIECDDKDEFRKLKQEFDNHGWRTFDIT